MNRYSESGRIPVFTLIALVIIIVLACIYVPKYRRNKEYIESLNGCRRLHGNAQWTECAEAYEALWSAFPEKGRTDADKVVDCYSQRALSAYGRAIGAKRGFEEAVTLFEKAATYGALGEEALFALADCYAEGEQKTKAWRLIEEARQRDDIDASRFTILERRLGRGR